VVAHLVVAQGVPTKGVPIKGVPTKDNYKGCPYNTHIASLPKYFILLALSTNLTSLTKFLKFGKANWY
jgi:hypothetical protein